MKHILILTSSLVVLFIMLINLYYSVIKLDIVKIEDYINESNEILVEVQRNKFINDKQKDEYINKLNDIEKDIIDSRTSYIIGDYKKYKLSMINSLKESIISLDKRDININKTNAYNEKAKEELYKIIKK